MAADAAALLNVDPINTFLPVVLANHTFGADTGLVGQQGRTMFDQLGGTLIIRNDGHYTDPTFELLDRLIN